MYGWTPVKVHSALVSCSTQAAQVETFGKQNEKNSNYVWLAHT